MAQASNVHSRAHVARYHLRGEIRAFLILSAGGFALGLALGFAVLGFR